MYTRITCTLAALLAIAPAAAAQTIFGLAHTPLGTAATTTGGVCPDCTLTVSNIGSSGDDGVRIDVGQPERFSVSFGDETDAAGILDGTQLRFIARSTAGAIGDVISSDLGDEIRSVGASFLNSTTFRLTAFDLDGAVAFDQPGNPIGTAFFAAAMPTTVRTWIRPDGNLVIEHRYGAPTRLTPPSGPDLFATAVQFISEAGTPIPTDALAAVDLRFRGEPVRTIVDEAVAMFDHDFRAVGGATIEPVRSPGERLSIPDFGAGDQGGVWAELFHPLGPAFNPDGVPIRATVNLIVQGSAPTAQVRFEARADFGGRGDQTAMSVDLHRNGSFWDVVPDASGVGSSTFRLELFLGASNVFTGGMRSGTVATIEPTSVEFPSVTFHIPSAAADAVAAELTLPFAGPVTVPGAGVFTADRIRIVSENHTRKPNFFDGVFLTGRDLQSIEITGVETTTAPLPADRFFFGYHHFSLGQATIAPSATGDGLVLSNIGSSGEDGVAGNTVAMEKLEIAHEGLTLDAAGQSVQFEVFTETASTAGGGGGTGVSRVGGKMHLEDVSLGVINYTRDPSHGPDALVEIYSAGVYQGGAVVPADQPVATIDVPAGGIEVDSMGFSAEPGEPTRLVIKMKRVYITSYQTGGASESAMGDEIRIGPADPADWGGLITRYELRAAGIPTVEINDLRFIRSRTGHGIVFDDASGAGPLLTPIPGLAGAYRVSNIGASGLDGVTFTPEPSNAPPPADPLYEEWIYAAVSHAVDPVIVSAPDQAVEFDVTLKRGTITGDLFLPTIHAVRERAGGRERIIEITADLTPLAPASSRAEFLFEGEVVAIEPNFSAGLLATIPADGATGVPNVVVRGWDASHRLARGTNTRSFQTTLRFDAVQAVLEPGALPVTIDSIAIVEEGFDPSITGVESLTLRGTNLGDFAVDTARTRGFPALAFGRSVVPLFNPHEFTISKSISWDPSHPDAPAGASFDLGGANGAGVEIAMARKSCSLTMYNIQGGGGTSHFEILADRMEIGHALDGLPAPDELRIASLLHGVVQDEVVHTPPFPAVLATIPPPPAGEARPLLIVAEDVEGEALVLPFRASWLDGPAQTQLAGGIGAVDADSVRFEYIYQSSQTDLDFLLQRAEINAFNIEEGDLAVTGLGLIAHEAIHAAQGAATISPSGLCPGCTLTIANIGASGEDGVEVRPATGPSWPTLILPMLEQSAPLVLTQPGSSVRFEPFVQIDGLTQSWGTYEIIKEGGQNGYIHSLPTRSGRGETLIQLFVGDDEVHSYIVFGDGEHGFIPETDDLVIVGFEFDQGTAPDGLGRVKIKFPSLHEFQTPGGALIRCDGISAEHLGSGETLDGVEAVRFTGRHLPPFAITAPAAPPACPCERTDDDPASVDVFDLLAYLALWFASDDAAELTGDDPANVDVFDLLAFLDCWFPASAGEPCL